MGETGDRGPSSLGRVPVRLTHMRSGTPDEAAGAIASTPLTLRSAEETLLDLRRKRGRSTTLLAKLKTEDLAPEDFAEPEGDVGEVEFDTEELAIEVEDLERDGMDMRVRALLATEPVPIRDDAAEEGDEEADASKGT